MPAYTGYNPNVNASIATEFSTVGFRFGHSMLNNNVARDANNGSSLGTVPLEQDFFDPQLVNPNGVPVTLSDGTTTVSTGIGAYLKGDADGHSQAVDTMAVSSIRDELFETGTGSTAGGEDLNVTVSHLRNTHKGKAE
jgi:peroxidase